MLHHYLKMLTINLRNAKLHYKKKWTHFQKKNLKETVLKTTMSLQKMLNH